VYVRASRSGELQSEKQIVDVRKKGFEEACLQPLTLTSTCRKCTIRALCVGRARHKFPALFIPFVDKIDGATCGFPSPPRGVHHEDILNYSASDDAAVCAPVLVLRAAQLQGASHVPQNPIRMSFCSPRTTFDTDTIGLGAKRRSVGPTALIQQQFSCDR
jgi:hypothetical protein